MTPDLKVRLSRGALLEEGIPCSRWRRSGFANHNNCEPWRTRGPTRNETEATQEVKQS
jgi:hypothetical protein